MVLIYKFRDLVYSYYLYTPILFIFSLKERDTSCKEVVDYIAI
jgi:hypothetical protein